MKPKTNTRKCPVCKVKMVLTKEGLISSVYICLNNDCALVSITYINDMFPIS